MSQLAEIETARLVAEEDYGLVPLENIEMVSGGRVNSTFGVLSPQGRFILQRLHPVFGADGRVVENSARAAQSMSAGGLPAPLARPTLRGSWWSGREGVWRLSLWLPGRPPSERSPATAAEAARVLGSFHRALRDFPPDLGPPPQAEFNREPASGGDDWVELKTKHRGEAKFRRAEAAIDKGLALGKTIPAIESATRAVLHGDPKLENFLFDESGRGLTLIDLDTVREGALLWELADALRSWAGKRTPGREIILDGPVFRAGVESYLRHGLELSSRERSALPEAAAAATLNLARRYLDDFFQESYFSWDRVSYPSLAEQNFSRAWEYLRLAGQFLEKRGELL
ncbi:MAG: phosphotransferase [Pseudomonadota bacterium]